MRILIFGLPGSGKTTLAKKLAELINISHFNADVVRQQHNDWDFSPEGRTRQLQRMKSLSHSVRHSVCDFVCPTHSLRAEFSADYTVWMNTIPSGRFEDTNAVFEKPTFVDLEITEFAADFWAKKLLEKLNEKFAFDWKKPTAQLLGRYQPPHDGHLYLFSNAIDTVGQACIMVRDTTQTDDKNPFEYSYIRQELSRKMQLRGYLENIDFVVMQVPNITNIHYGRDVGYKIEKIEVSPELEAISATAIRKEMFGETK